MRLTHPLLLAAALLAAADSFAADSDTRSYYMLVFSAPANASQEAEYNRWYEQQHAPDVVAVPGFATAQRFIESDQQLGTGFQSAPLPKYLALYTIETSDYDGVMAEVAARVKSGRTVISPSFDRSTVTIYTYEAHGPKITAHHASHSRTCAHTYVHFVLTVPRAGLEDEFNNWYDRQHAPEMAALPGFVSAQRLLLKGSGPVLVPATKYAALFEICASSLREASAAMQSMPRPVDAPIDASLTKGYTYRAIDAVITGNAIRRARAP